MTHARFVDIAVWYRWSHSSRRGALFREPTVDDEIYDMIHVVNFEEDNLEFYHDMRNDESKCILNWKYNIISEFIWWFYEN